MTQLEFWFPAKQRIYRLRPRYTPAEWPLYPDDMRFGDETLWRIGPHLYRYRDFWEEAVDDLRRKAVKA